MADELEIVRDLFLNVGKLLVGNVACYKALAKLPNSEKAHVTVRQSLWWKDVFDCVFAEFPDVSVGLICSAKLDKAQMIPFWRARARLDGEDFVT